MNCDNKEYGQQVLRLLKKLVESDGVVSTEEVAWMDYIRRELGQTESDAPFEPEKLKAAVQKEDEAEELVSLLLMLSLADGVTDSAELAIVKSIAELVNVSESRMEELRAKAQQELA